MRLVTSSPPKRRRRAAVPGRSNGRMAMRIEFSNDGLVCHIAAPEDGRTPGTFPIAIVSGIEFFGK